MSDRSPSAPPMASWTATFFTRLYRYKRLLKNRWYILAFCAAAGAAVQAYRLTGKETSYTSTAKMIVSQRVAVPDNTMVREATNTFFGDQIDLMRSTEVRQRALARVAATQPDIPRGPVSLDVQQQPYTSIFVLSSTGTQPAYTQAFLDAVMDEYINLRRESRSETSQDAVSLMTEQMVRLEKDVKQGEEELQKFLTTNNILFLEEQSQAAVKRLQELRTQLSEMESEHRLLGMMTFEQNIEHLKTQTQGDASTETAAAQAEAQAAAAGISDPTMAYQQTMADIRRLEVEIKDLARHLKPAHPKMIRLNDELERQKRLIESFKAESMESLKAKRETLALRIENLKQTIAAEEKNAMELSQRMGEYNRLKTRLTRYQQMYDKLFESTQRVDISSNVDQEQVSIYVHASPPQANTPHLFSGVLNGAALGLVLGIGILLLLDRIDDRINSLTELRDHFDEPVLGQIPLDPNGRGKDLSLITPDDKRHQYVEAYRNVRSSLRFMVEDKNRPVTLLVTSAVPSEGKSTFSANLALTMVFAGSRVLLVDADLRRGRAHDIFGRPSNPGLSEVLNGDLPWREAVVPTGYDNLSLLPRGSTPPNPGELLLSERCDQVLAEWAQAYDQIIIDSAPILATDDTASLAPKINTTLFLLRTGFTSARLVHSALDVLAQRHVNVLGLVLNGVNTELPEYYYYQYRDYYSRATS